jgi:hypothetical protein
MASVNEGAAVAAPTRAALKEQREQRNKGNIGKSRR